jgi:hypothetical protein
MTTYDDSLTHDVRDLAKGIAVRAGILSVAGIVAGAFLFSLAAKAASGLVKIVAGVLLLGIAGGFGAWQVRKVRRHFGGGRDMAELP